MKAALPILFLVLSSVVVHGQESQNYNVYFDRDSYKISEAEKLKLTDWLKQFTDTLKKIEVTGHADFLHSTEYNLDLSQRRANAVMQLIEEKRLINYGMSLVSAKGEEFSQPSNRPTGNPLDRKVEIVVYPKELQASVEPEAEIEQKDDSGPDLIERASVGQTIVLKNLNFFPGRHFLIPQALPELERLIKILERNPTMEIEVHGHICCKLDSLDGLDLNTKTKTLSYNRAKYIHDQLVLAGIDSSRIGYRGFAGSRPLVVPELTPEDRQKNRRVEIKILKK